MVSTRSRTNSSPTAAAPAAPAKKRPAAESAVAPATKKPAAMSSSFVVGKPVNKTATLFNQDGKEVHFVDTYKDKGVVFFMYPKANTPGCTKQACGFRDNIQTIKDAGFTVYGLSGDSPKALSSWKTKEDLPFDLLSDPTHELIKYFGSSIGGTKTQRSHVVILKGGVVGDIQAKVSPAESVSRAVEFVKNNSTSSDGNEASELTTESTSAPTTAPAEEEAVPTEPTVGKVTTFNVELETEISKKVQFQDLFKDRGAIFFMYPKADTPGCTIQACGFNDNLAEINAAGFDVYGLGGDSPAELLAWKESQKYGYTLLSDPKHTLIKFFGSSLENGTRVERSHVIILPGGKVGEIAHNVTPQDSVAKGLEFVKNHASKL